MDGKSQKFGDILHKNVSAGSVPFKIPTGFDPGLLDPSKRTNFLTDDVKALLGIPLSNKPHMALVEEEVFTIYLEKMSESAQKLDELMMMYEDIDNSLPGQGKDMLRATVQNSLRLASRLKSSPMHHMTLAGLGRWLKQQKIDIDKTYEGLDNFAAEAREKEEAEAAEAAARAAAEEAKSAHGGVEDGIKSKGVSEGGFNARFEESLIEDREERETDASFSGKSAEAKKMSMHSAALAAAAVSPTVDKTRASLKQASVDPVRSSGGVGAKPKNDADVAAAAVAATELTQLRGTIQSQTQELGFASTKLKQAEEHVDQANATIEELKQQLQQLDPSFNPSDPATKGKGGAKGKRRGGGMPEATSPAVTLFPGAAAALNDGAGNTAVRGSMGPTGGAPLSVTIPPSPSYQGSPMGGAGSATTASPNVSPIPSAPGMTPTARGSTFTPQASPVTPSGGALSGGASSGGALGGGALSGGASSGGALSGGAASGCALSGGASSGGASMPATQKVASQPLPPASSLSKADMPATDAQASDGEDETRVPQAHPASSSVPSSSTKEKKSVKKKNGKQKTSGDVADSSETHGAVLAQAVTPAHKPIETIAQAANSMYDTITEEEALPPINGGGVSPDMDVRKSGKSKPAAYEQEGGVQWTDPVADVLRKDLKRLRAEGETKDAEIAKLHQEVKEMSQALGETAATVEGAADDSSRRRSRSSRSGARLSGRSARGRSASMYGRESDDEDSYDDEDDEYACGHSHRKSSLHKPRRSRAAHQKEADLAKYTEDPNDEELPEGWKSCPRCLELERQLKYWREKSWYQKVRDARWDKLKADRGDISVNVGSKFTGLVVEKDAPSKGITFMAPGQLNSGQTMSTKKGGTQSHSVSGQLHAIAADRGKVRASKSVPGGMNASPARGFASPPPPPAVQPKPYQLASDGSLLPSNGSLMDSTSTHHGPALGLDAVGVADDVGTLKSVSNFTPASAALGHRQDQGFASAQNSKTYTRKMAGGHGTGTADPFALPKSLQHLVDGRRTQRLSGVAVQVGEMKRGTLGRGEAGKLPLGGDLRLGSGNRPPPSADRHRQSGTGSALRKPPGRHSQLHQERESLLEAICLHGSAKDRCTSSHNQRIHLEGSGTVGPWGGPSGTEQSHAGEPAPSLGASNFATAAHAQGTELRYHQNTLAVRGVHSEGQNTLEQASRAVAADLRVDLSPSNVQGHPGHSTLEAVRGNSNRPAATSGVRGSNSGKIVARKRIQDSTGPVDHVTFMLEEKGALLSKITSAASPSTLQTAPAKKSGVKALVAAQQAKVAADNPVGGQRQQDLFTINGKPPPRQI